MKGEGSGIKSPKPFHATKLSPRANGRVHVREYQNGFRRPDRRTILITRIPRQEPRPGSKREADGCVRGPVARGIAEHGLFETHWRSCDETTARSFEPGSSKNSVELGLGFPYGVSGLCTGNVEPDGARVSNRQILPPPAVRTGQLTDGTTVVCI